MKKMKLNNDLLLFNVEKRRAGDKKQDWIAFKKGKANHVGLAFHAIYKLSTGAPDVTLAEPVSRLLQMSRVLRSLNRHAAD